MNCVNGQIAKNDISCTQNNVIDRTLDIGKLSVETMDRFAHHTYGTLYCKMLHISNYTN